METVANERLRELIEYECLSVSSFKNKMCRKLGVKIKHYGNNKSNDKKRALNARTEIVKSLSALTTNVRRIALKTSGTQENLTQEKTGNLNAV